MFKGRLDLPWSYYASGWAPNAAAVSLRLLPGIAPAFSVIDLGAGRGIRVITQQPLMGQAIYSWHAASPVDPFTTQHTIYNTPSFGARTYTHNTLAHPSTPSTARCCSHSTSTASTRSRRPTPRCTARDSSGSRSLPSKRHERDGRHGRAARSDLPATLTATGSSNTNARRCPPLGCNAPRTMRSRPGIGDLARPLTPRY